MQPGGGGGGMVGALELDMEQPTPSASVAGAPAASATAGHWQRADVERDEKVVEAARMMLDTADSWEGYVGIVRPGGVKKNQHKEWYLRLENGSLQFYDNQTAQQPGRQDLIRAVRSIRWSGIEVETPLERFRMYQSGGGKKQAAVEDPQQTHTMFQALGAFHESKKAIPPLKQAFVPASELNGCMQVGELGDGRVLYRAEEGMNEEERHNDILRLSIAMQLVEEEALKQKLNFKGWVQKSSRSEGSGRNKERYLKVGDGHLSFYDDTTSVRPVSTYAIPTTT